MCLVCLPSLDMDISDFLYNIMRGDYSGTTYGPLFNNDLFSILKCARAIPAVNNAL